MRARVKVLKGIVRIYSAEETLMLLENPVFPRERGGGVGSVLTHESPELELDGRWGIGSTTTERMIGPMEGQFSVEFLDTGSVLFFIVNEQKMLAIRVLPVGAGDRHPFYTHEANALTLAAIS